MAAKVFNVMLEVELRTLRKSIKRIKELVIFSNKSIYDQMRETVGEDEYYSASPEEAKQVLESLMYLQIDRDNPFAETIADLVVDLDNNPKFEYKSWMPKGAAQFLEISKGNVYTSSLNALYRRLIEMSKEDTPALIEFIRDFYVEFTKYTEKK